MSDSELWKKAKEQRQKKRWDNYQSSMYILEGRNIDYEVLDEATGHVKVGDWSFWPTTGKFYNSKTKEKGRGVFNLIKKINAKSKQRENNR